MGFRDSYRTLCNFIQEWKSTEENDADKGHELLDHPEGEVHLDFGVMEAVQNVEIIGIFLKRRITVVLEVPVTSVCLIVSLLPLECSTLYSSH
ncbi:hypothetical protein AB1K09_05355 [Solibacillus silvestris]